ncbi:MAG: hypothetical protein VYB65_09410 [Myxococcota bacterium]|nr:hypothetical protein [Myxococcota bacterium]
MSDPARDAALVWAVGTRGGLGHLEGLPPERIEQLSEAVQKVLDLPREQRVAFAGREARRLSASRLRRGLEGIDPSWIVEALRGEEPHVVAAALVYLPTPVRRTVVKLLPRKVREAMPDRKTTASVEQLWLVRCRDVLDRRIQTLLPDLQRGAQIDVAALELRLRALGRVEAALGLYRVGRSALARFIATMEPEDRALVQEELKAADTMEDVRVERAERFWGRGAGVDQKADDLHLRAGLWQLAHVLIVERYAAHLRSYFLYLPRRWVQELELMTDKVREPEEGFAERLLTHLDWLPGDA